MKKTPTTETSLTRGCRDETKDAARSAAGASEKNRTERLRHGFHIVVAQTAEPARSPIDGPALALQCPLGPERTARVRLSIVRGVLDPAPPGGAVFVVIDTDLLQRILNADYEQLPARIAEIGAKPIDMPRTAELTLAAHAVRRCRHRGAIRNLFLKSKALEMLALAFGALKRDAAKADLLPVRDRQALTRARDLLLQRLDDPPCLNELASVAGMCETRLKVAFKSLFGETPSTLSRRARMAAARDMLIERRCRVSEAASAVGYTNVSHFIDAFVKEYGVRPGSLAHLVRTKEP